MGGRLPRTCDKGHAPKVPHHPLKGSRPHGPFGARRKNAGNMETLHLGVCRETYRALGEAREPPAFLTARDRCHRMALLTEAEDSGMYRLLIIIGLLVLLVFLIRRATLEFRRGNGGPHEPAKREQMVQDPVCGIYVPKETAVAERIRGETYYFCSTDCAQAFQSRHSSQHPEEL